MEICLGLPRAKLQLAGQAQGLLRQLELEGRVAVPHRLAEVIEPIHPPGVGLRMSSEPGLQAINRGDWASALTTGSQAASNHTQP